MTDHRDTGARAEPVPEAYIIGHVQEALGTDSRVGEWGLHVEVGERSVTIAGTVTTAARKAAVATVARAALASLGCHHDVHDETLVAAATSPDHEEAL